jgi:hypothetical protein
MSEEVVIKGMLSNEGVEALKNKFPGLKSILFQNYDTNEQAVVYIKKIPRQVYEQALKLSDKQTRVTVGEYLLKNLRVDGMDADEIINDIYWLGEFSAQAETLIMVHQGEVKKN